MELRQLRYFVAVAEELHFSRAAARLHVSQPPLTVAIRQLEAELRTPLFVRTTRSVALTPAGAALLERARELLVDVDAAAAHVSGVGVGLAGRLRLGFVSSASYEVLPAALRGFRERRPGVRLELEPLTSGEQLERLLAGELDLGIVRDVDPVPGLRLETLAVEPLVCVLPDRHPLAAAPAVSPAALREQPLVLFPWQRMPGYLRRVLELFDDDRRALDIVQQVVHQETVLGLVAAGIGLSVLPASIGRVRTDGVTTRPIAGAPTTVLQLALPREPTAAARAFAHVLGHE